MKKKRMGEKKLGEKRLRRLEKRNAPVDKWIDMPKADCLILNYLRSEPEATIDEISNKFPAYKLQTIQNSVNALRRMGLARC